MRVRTVHPNGTRGTGLLSTLDSSLNSAHDTRPGKMDILFALQGNTPRHSARWARLLADRVRIQFRNVRFIAKLRNRALVLRGFMRHFGY